MKAGAAKSRPEWRSPRETNEGRSSQQQARMEIMQGDKWRETNEGRGSQEQARMEITQGDKWREANEGKQMKAGAAKSRPEWNEGRSSQYALDDLLAWFYPLLPQYALDALPACFTCVSHLSPLDFHLSPNTLWMLCPHDFTCLSLVSACLPHVSHFALHALSAWFYLFVGQLVPQTGLPVRGSYSFERGACSGRMI